MLQEIIAILGMVALVVLAWGYWMYIVRSLRSILNEWHMSLDDEFPSFNHQPGSDSDHVPGTTKANTQP